MGVDRTEMLSSSEQQKTTKEEIKEVVDNEPLISRENIQRLVDAFPEKMPIRWYIDGKTKQVKSYGYDKQKKQEFEYTIGVFDKSGSVTGVLDPFVPTEDEAFVHETALWLGEHVRLERNIKQNNEILHEVSKQIELVNTYGIDWEAPLELMQEAISGGVKYSTIHLGQDTGSIVNGEIWVDTKPGDEIIIGSERITNTTQKQRFVRLPFTTYAQVEGEYLVDKGRSYRVDVSFDNEKRKATYTPSEMFATGGVEHIGNNIYLYQGERYVGEELISQMKRTNGEPVVVGEILTATPDEQGVIHIQTDQAEYLQFPENHELEGKILPRDLSDAIVQDSFYHKVSRGLNMLYGKEQTNRFKSIVVHQYESGMYLDNVFAGWARDKLVQLNGFYKSILRDDADVKALSNKELLMIMHYMQSTGKYGSPEYFQEEKKLPQASSYEAQEQEYESNMELLGSIYEQVDGYAGEIPTTTTTLQNSQVSGYYITEQWLIETFSYTKEQLRALSGDKPFQFIRITEKPQEDTMLGMAHSMRYENITYISHMPFVVVPHLVGADKKVAFSGVLLQEMQHAYKGCDEPGSELPNLLMGDKDLIADRVHGALGIQEKQLRRFTKGYQDMICIYQKSIRDVIGEEKYKEYQEKMSPYYISSESMQNVTHEQTLQDLDELLTPDFIENLAKAYYGNYYGS